MGRTKETRRIIHQPSTPEIFDCISCMPAYSKLLLEQFPNKPYSVFLHGLIDNNFYNDRNEKITIKRIASDFKTDAVKVTKWLKEIYEQLFELNRDKPEIFRTNGVKVYLIIQNYDSSCYIYTSLPVLPREFETIRFPFVKGKVGADSFWVKKVEHEIIEDSVEVLIWLEGGLLNKYREFALDKALFQDRIHFMDVFNLPPDEIDKELRMLYRN